MSGQNRTKNDKLTPTQSAAIDHLATGSSVTDAAKAANVTRQTVSGWLNHDPTFQAALNSRRTELWAAPGLRRKHAEFHARLRRTGRFHAGVGSGIGWAGKRVSLAAAYLKSR